MEINTYNKQPRIIILDTLNQDIGLKILFPNSDYYIMKTEYDKSFFFNKYNIKPNLFTLTSIIDCIDLLFIIFPLYNCVKTYNNKINVEFFYPEFYKMYCDILNIISLNENKIKKICFFDNGDYDFDPNTIDIIFPKIPYLFFKRNFNKNINYLNNVFSFPYIMFGHKCMIDLTQNILKPLPLNEKKKQLFFAGNIYKHIDNVYGCFIDRESIFFKIKKKFGDFFVFYNNLYDIYYINELKKSKFCLDLLGAGEPNIRTFEIFNSGSLIISQKGSLFWPFNYDNIFFNDLTYFTDENDLKNKIDILNNNDELYNICLNQQNFIVNYYMNIDYLKNYILLKTENGLIPTSLTDNGTVSNITVNNTKKTDNTLNLFVNGFWSGFIEKTNPCNITFFFDLFKMVFNANIELSNNYYDCDILLESGFNNYNSVLNSKKWKYSFLFSGESYIKNSGDYYDCVLYGIRNHKNIVNLPLFLIYNYCMENSLQTNEEKPLIHTNGKWLKNKPLIPNKDIVVFISNPNGSDRNFFLEKLEKEFNVDYAGSYKNNIIFNEIEPFYNNENFYSFISQYKFIISMENSDFDTYITEKITHGFYAGNIPIYWGSKRIGDYFNEKRFLNIKDITDVKNVFFKIKQIINNDNLYLQIVNEPIFVNNCRNIYNVVSDIKKLFINPNNIHPNTFIISSPIFEPNRFNRLTDLFYNNIGIPNDFIHFMCPTYKHTITNDIYNEYVLNDLMINVRTHPFKKAELSLILNYKFILEFIEKNYFSGVFLIFESDVLLLDNTYCNFINNLPENGWDLIHFGIGGENEIFNSPFCSSVMPFRPKLNDYYNSIPFIEDLFIQNTRLIRKFHTRCTDSFIWNYSGVVKFLYHLNNIELNYGYAFDYYLINFFEQNINNFKHYWTVKSYFMQGSNYNLDYSTIQDIELINTDNCINHKDKYNIILFDSPYFHHKNKLAFLSYNNTNIIVVNSIKELNDKINGFMDNNICVYSPTVFINCINYPKQNICWIFGPHFSVFPEKNIINNIIQLTKIGYKITYIQPSVWAKNAWYYFSFCKELKIVDIPFGVDTEKFKPIYNRYSLIQNGKVFIYFKSRHPDEFMFLKNFFIYNNIPFDFFSYNDKYNEIDYLNVLQHAKYGIWLDAHESQGFALQEALSCNVPLLIWNVSSMKQEYAQNYSDIPASSIPYWDKRCGEFFYIQNDFFITFNKFISNLHNYKPRDFILENLSMKVCEKKFMNIII